jgi:hypothetical protein
MFPTRLGLAFAASALLAVAAAHAQGGLTLPPDADNQKSTVTQGIGLVRVTIDYNSPHVHRGGDRTGKIWGQLVPYGMANLGFGTCGDQCPWRGGANENTVFTVSQDVKVQGQPLPAGSYGLHFLPGKDSWTVIFSKNYTSWGSFFYDVKEDALRVEAKPEKSEFHEFLTYEFPDRQPDKATVALLWENLKIPFTVTVDNIADLYIGELQKQLRNSQGFTPQGWQLAAQYSLQSKSHLDEGLRWAEHAVDENRGGSETFSTLLTLYQLQEANGKGDDAKKTLAKALNSPTATPIGLHQLGRQLQGLGRNDEALKIFELNAKRNPGVWPTELGLARGYAAVGKTDEAIQHAKLAGKQAPDDANRANVENLIRQWEGEKKKG